jgi:ABC-type multidrug transport system fused ATPase/permease subunit
MNTYKRFKIIVGYLKRYQRELGFLAVLGLVSAVANGVVPYLAGNLFDAILKPSKIFVLIAKIPLWLFFIILWAIVELIASVVDWQSGLKNAYLVVSEFQFRYKRGGSGEKNSPPCRKTGSERSERPPETEGFWRTEAKRA